MNKARIKKLKILLVCSSLIFLSAACNKINSVQPAMPPKPVVTKPIQSVVTNPPKPIVPTKPVVTKPVQPIALGSATVTIANHTLSVEVARTQAAQAKGLSGRDSLGENDGMLFVFASPSEYAFWMKDMKFALDFIWISNNKVIQITPNIAPEPGVADAVLPNYLPSEPVDSVIEVNAGWASRNNIKVGDTVVDNFNN